MTEDKKILLAGPWVGEFGHELFCWQAYVRKLSREFKKTIIVGRPGHKYLYEDFCSEYIEFDPKSYKTNGRFCIDAESPSDIIKNIDHTFYFDGNFDIGVSYSKKEPKNNLLLSIQEFYKYEFKGNKNYDLIFHCRNKSTGPDRNWSKECWHKLYESLPARLKIACIGNSEAFYIEGTDDLRGIEIKELVGILNQSKLIIGPSSGPMHLASLCGMTHLVWSIEYNRRRYESEWNPFKTKVIFHSDGGWNPDFKQINKLILDNI
jgi:ADP-heptose:LPS heptosyltransferase